MTQIKNSLNVEENFQTIKKALKIFASSDVDLILFPECGLSGFSGKLNGNTYEALYNYFQEVEKWSLKYRKYVFLPSAITKDQVNYNSGYLFGNDKPIQFFKLGLTKSERTFFSTPTHETKKIFKIKGYNLALVICFEAELSFDQYFKEGQVDVVLWPGYWGWQKGESWKEKKISGEANIVYENMTKWKIPLIQANFAFNDLREHRGKGPHGMSMFVNSDNTLAGSGDYDSESCYEVYVSDNEIKYCQKLGSL